MQKFIAKFGASIQGVISGFDRLVLGGSRRAIQYQFGMMATYGTSKSGAIPYIEQD